MSQILATRLSKIILGMKPGSVKTFTIKNTDNGNHYVFRVIRRSVGCFHTYMKTGRGDKSFAWAGAWSYNHHNKLTYKPMDIADGMAKYGERLYRLIIHPRLFSSVLAYWPTKCHACNKMLYDPLSIAMGMGHTCHKKGNRVRTNSSSDILL